MLSKKWTCEIHICVYVFAQIMYTFLGHYNLFQAIEKYATPKQTSNTLQK